MKMTYLLRNGRLVPKHLATPLTKAADPRMHVISDTMAPTRHMATGKIHDSKAAFRADTRATGCVEVGTDPAIRRAPKRDLAPMVDIVNDVKKAIAQLRSR